MRKHNFVLLSRYAVIYTHLTICFAHFTHRNIMFTLHHFRLVVNCVHPSPQPLGMRPKGRWDCVEESNKQFIGCSQYVLFYKRCIVYTQLSKYMCVTTFGSKEQRNAEPQFSLYAWPYCLWWFFCLDLGSSRYIQTLKVQVRGLGPPVVGFVYFWTSHFGELILRMKVIIIKTHIFWWIINFLYVSIFIYLDI